jgi:hypothetical protein
MCANRFSNNRTGAEQYEKVLGLVVDFNSSSAAQCCFAAEQKESN